MTVQNDSMAPPRCLSDRSRSWSKNAGNYAAGTILFFTGPAIAPRP
jgi:hypothetical protein